MTRPKRGNNKELRDYGEALIAWDKCRSMIVEAARDGDRRALRLVEMGEDLARHAGEPPLSQEESDFINAMSEWIWG